jgi:outer membrane protein assembly factor BamA
MAILQSVVDAIGNTPLVRLDRLTKNAGVTGAILAKWALLGYETGSAGNPTGAAAPFLTFRATAGISFQWRSPFGPIQIDLALPYVKTSYDRPQIIHFSTATGF